MKERKTQQVQRSIKTYNSRIGKHWIVFIGSDCPYRWMPSVLKIRTWGITLLSMRCVLYALAETEKTDSKSILDDVCPVLCRGRRRLAIWPLDWKRCETRGGKKKHDSSCSDGETMIGIGLSNSSWLDWRILSLPGLSHNCHYHYRQDFHLFFPSSSHACSPRAWRSATKGARTFTSIWDRWQNDV